MARLARRANGQANGKPRDGSWNGFDGTRTVLTGERRETESGCDLCVCVCVERVIICLVCVKRKTKCKVYALSAHPRATARHRSPRVPTRVPRPEAATAAPDRPRAINGYRTHDRTIVEGPRSDVHIHMNLGGHERVHEHREDGARQAGLHPTVCDAQPRAFKYVSKVGVRARDRRVRAVDVESIRRA